MKNMWRSQTCWFA